MRARRRLDQALHWQQRFRKLLRQHRIQVSLCLTSSRYPDEFKAAVEYAEGYLQRDQQWEAEQSHHDSQPNLENTEEIDGEGGDEEEETKDGKKLNKECKHLTSSVVIKTLEYKRHDQEEETKKEDTIDGLISDKDEKSSERDKQDKSEQQKVPFLLRWSQGQEICG